MNTQEQNEGQHNRLSLLRESIKQQKEFSNSPVPQLRKMAIDVPTVSEEKGSEFDLERYEQLAHKVDILYNNYIVYRQDFTDAGEKFAQGMKELAQGLDDIINEGTKPRF